MELCTTGSGFVPINGYLGNFDGKGYTISNIYVKRSGNCGLFAVMTGNYAIIRNLTINGEITSTDGYAAGFVALPYGTLIENCVNDVDTTGTQAGGFSGYFRYGSSLIFRNCINNGKITANDTAGGITGYAYHGMEITDCVNNGEIHGNLAGGIVGYHYTSLLIINKCYNDAKVNGNNAGGIVGHFFIGTLKILNSGVSLDSEFIGKEYSGGILGCHDCYGVVYISNSYVLAKLAGDKYIGGIAGRSWSRADYSGIKHQIENSYFAGTIEGGTKVGGIVGINNCASAEQISFTNCYYINTIEKGISNSEMSGITALSEQDMKQNNTLLTNLQGYTNAEQELTLWTKLSNEYPINGR